MLLAIIVLAVAIVSLVVVQAYTARNRSLDQTHLVASQLASSAIAEIKEQSAQDFDTDHRRSEVEIAPSMFLTVEVEDDWAGSPNLKSVSATVFYKSGSREKGGRVVVRSVLRKTN